MPNPELGAQGLQGRDVALSPKAQDQRWVHRLAPVGTTRGSFKLNVVPSRLLYLS